MPKTPRYSATGLVRLLEANGWQEVSQNGSHRKFRHPDRAEIIVVPVHGGDMKTGTLNKILKQAGLL